MEGMKWISIVGARPQFVKAAVVSRCMRQAGGMEEMLVHTGQHYDPMMSEVFFEEMQIPAPAVNLQVHALSQGAMTGQMLEKIEAVLMRERPDGVLVYGDTNSTLAGALAAKKLGLPLAHVEAGLRSFDRRMPEEINRALTDRISDVLFCPTEKAVELLAKEGIAGPQVVLCGDVMQDAALFYAPMAHRPDAFAIEKPFVLCTVHRAETTDDSQRLRAVFSALEQIAESCEVVIPLHPRTRKALENIAYPFSRSRLHWMEPVGYLAMVWLLQHCGMVLTDSGGLQKEAYFFRRPCVTLRNETEWVELVENGYNVLAGTDSQRILQAFHAMRERPVSFADAALYGKGDAGRKIVEVLQHYKG